MERIWISLSELAACHALDEPGLLAAWHVWLGIPAALLLLLFCPAPARAAVFSPGSLEGPYNLISGN